MKTYFLLVTFPERKVETKKQFVSDKKARFWAQLCLDICGKDEHGRRYLSANLSSGEKTVHKWA